MIDDKMKSKIQWNVLFIGTVISITLGTLLSFIFILLKVFYVIDWEWIIVLLPLLIGYFGIFVVVGIVFVVNAITIAIKHKEFKRLLKEIDR